MPIDADKVRELAARGEGTKLDYKGADYDWDGPGKGAANAELAKDIMAMANALGPSSEPAYILVGVIEEPRTIVGISKHHDDADLHAKVRPLLNKPPAFSYSVVDVDGARVGVYEILAGGRPYFPIKGTPPLQVPLACYRDGTATAHATPAQIIEWHREDDVDTHKLRSLELEEREAERKIRGRIYVRDVRTPTSEGTAIVIRIENRGRRSIRIGSASCTFEWTPKFLGILKASVERIHPTQVTPTREDREHLMRGEVPPDLQPLRAGGDPREAGIWVPPGTGPADGASLQLMLPAEPIIAYFADLGLPFEALERSWFRINVAVEVESELGRQETLTTTWDESTE